MYFVVYLYKLNKHYIVPKTWIDGIESQMEKFVNISLNRSQIFLIYYTTNEAAFIDGRPDPDFNPNFSKIVTDLNADGTFDGCFHGILKQFKLEFADAVEFSARLRNVSPPIYNSLRLKEKPIPPTAIHDNVQPSTSSEQVTTSNESYEPPEASDEDSFVEPLIYESDPDNSENVSKDPLEFGANESIGSMEFHGFDGNSATNANGKNDDSVTVQNNPNGNSTNKKQLSTKSDGESASNGDKNQSNDDVSLSAQHSPVADADSATNDAENQSIDGANKSPNNSTVTNDNVNDASVAVIGENLTNQNEVTVEATAENSAANNGSNTEINPEHTTVAVVTKIEQPAYFYDVHSTNSADIDDVLDEPEEITWEKDPDVVMTIGRSGFPMPWLATDGNIIKREGDLMSGNISFNETKSGGRVYVLGDKLIEIPKKVVEKVIEWNQGAKRYESEYDKKVCHMLLLSLVSKEGLRKREVNEYVMQFIKDCFVIRSGKDRSEDIEKYKDDICTEA